MIQLKTLDEQRSINASENYVELKSHLSLDSVSSIHDFSDKIPFVLRLSDQKIDLDGIVQNGNSQTCSLCSVYDQLGFRMINGYVPVGISLFNFALGVARAESCGAHDLAISRSMFYGISDGPKFELDLQNLVDIGTNSGADIKLHYLGNYRDNITSRPNIRDQSSILLISGGTDSVVAGALEKSRGQKISLMQINYGQAARNQEIYCVDRLHEYFGIENQLCRVEMGQLKTFGGSGLLRDDITINRQNAHIEYVPFRNSIFLSLALAKAEMNGVAQVILGAHNDDTMAPDGTQKYVDAFNKVLSDFSGYNQKITAPLLSLGGKPELISMGLKLGIEFKDTWSCHSHIPAKSAGSCAIACGTCGNCRTRYSAFEKLGLADPISYATKEGLRTKWSGPTGEYSLVLESIKNKTR